MLRLDVSYSIENIKYNNAPPAHHKSFSNNRDTQQLTLLPRYILFLISLLLILLFGIGLVPLSICVYAQAIRTQPQTPFTHSLALSFASFTISSNSLTVIWIPKRFSFGSFVRLLRAYVRYICTCTYLYMYPNAHYIHKWYFLHFDSLSVCVRDIGSAFVYSFSYAFIKICNIFWRYNTTQSHRTLSPLYRCWFLFRCLSVFSALVIVIIIIISFVIGSSRWVCVYCVYVYCLFYPIFRPKAYQAA